jgi:hypothetical protein
VGRFEVESAMELEVRLQESGDSPFFFLFENSFLEKLVEYSILNR